MGEPGNPVIVRRTQEPIPSILPIPDLFAGRRILAVQPHYDDNDIAAGGTLALLADAGAELIYCTVTDDLVGVVDDTLTATAAAASLLRDQTAAGSVIGVARQIHLGYPDAGAWDRFAVRADLLSVIREVRPDVVLTADPWLPYEAHRDHRETGLVTAEAVILAGFSRLPGSRPEIDAAWRASGHVDIRAVGFYHTATPNVVVDIESVWDRKVAAVSEYGTQFDADEIPDLIAGLDAKARLVASGAGTLSPTTGRAEGLTLLDPRALHGAA